MSEKSDSGATERKPAYVWDPQKLAWVEATEKEVEPATPKAEETKAEARAEEVALEAPKEKAAQETVQEARLAAITGEAGGLQYRGAWLRLGGFLVDFIVLVLIGYALSRVVHMPGYAFYGIQFVYFVGFWWWRGQTPGKMLIRARVVKRDGSPVGLVRSILRYIIFGIYFFLIGLLGGGLVPYLIIGVIAFLVIAFTRRKRGLHDFVAGTVVVDSRTAAPQAVATESTDTSETAEEPDTGEPETDKQS
jgi:uncharacterized RDD family membrane protein YckC